MAKTTLREIMKRGHQLAKEMEGDYLARMALGLKVAWAEYKNKEDEKVFFYKTNYGSPEAAKVKAAGAKWNRDWKVWESEKEIAGVQEAKPNHNLVFYNNGEKAKKARFFVDVMSSMKLRGKELLEEKFKQMLTYFQGGTYEDECCLVAVKLYRELVKSGKETRGFWQATTEEIHKYLEK